MAHRAACAAIRCLTAPTTRLAEGFKNRCFLAISSPSARTVSSPRSPSTRFTVTPGSFSNAAAKLAACCRVPCQTGHSRIVTFIVSLLWANSTLLNSHAGRMPSVSQSARCHFGLGNARQMDSESPLATENLSWGRVPRRQRGCQMQELAQKEAQSCAIAVTDDRLFLMISRSVSVPAIFGKGSSIMTTSLHNKNSGTRRATSPSRTNGSGALHDGEKTAAVAEDLCRREVTSKLQSKPGNGFHDD